MEALRRLWSTELQSHRRILVAVGLGVVALISAWSFLRRPEYVPLYGRLEVEEAARVVEALQKLGIPYRLSGAGTTVEVPRERLYSARLQLASQGLPRSGGAGWELFDRSSFAATELVQRVNLQRALAGELVRSIETLEVVESARVHLTLPEDRLFQEESIQPSASVVLRLRPGAHLAGAQVRAIRHLVASAVAGLSPDRVTVVDTEGRLLSPGQEDPTGAIATQLDERAQVEAALQGRLQTMLDQLLGPGRAIARVSAEVDLSRRQVEQESFSPEQRAPTSEVSVEESYTGRGGLPPGGPATSSIPSYATNPAAQGGAEYRRRESRATYQVTRRLERAVSTGGIRRLSVAVLVDSRVPLEAVRALEPSIAAAVGLDRRRGDVLVVQAVEFPVARAPSETQASAAPAEARRKLSLTLLLAAAGGALLLLLLLALLLLRRRRWSVTVEAVQHPLPPALPEPQEDEEERVLQVLRERQEEEESAARQELQRLAQERPAEVAAVIKSWLAEK